MYFPILLGILLLVFLLLVGRWYAQADPKTVVKVLKWALVTIAVVVILFLVMTGRFVFALAALPALIPWFIRLRRAARMAKAFHRMAQGSGKSTQSSEIQTRFLKMSLSHETGLMWGEVLEGPYVGKALSDLPFSALSDLLMTCQQEDPQSAQILMAYLDREHPGWRDTAQAQGKGQEQGQRGYENSGTDSMTRQEAFKILGLEEGASEALIREAHHRLIAILHPDKGGSTYLAAKINQAKDFLLGS